MRIKVRLVILSNIYYCIYLGSFHHYIVIDFFAQWIILLTIDKKKQKKNPINKSTLFQGEQILCESKNKKF